MAFFRGDGHHRSAKAWFGRERGSNRIGEIPVKGARSVSKVFSRGFLIGATEWLLVIPASWILAGKTVSEVTARSGRSDAADAGAAIGGGLFAFISGGIAITMAVVCLICFAVSYLIGREMKPESAPQTAPTKKCPDCAELVQADAKKCRYCGGSFATVHDEDMPAPAGRT